MAAGEPGQAGKLDPRGPNKFEPGTKAASPESPHDDHPHKGKTPQRPPRPQPK